MPREIVRTEEIERDDIAYKLLVYKSGDAFTASWTCLLCERSNEPAVTYASAAAALGAAKAKLFTDHHLLLHAIINGSTRGQVSRYSPSGG